MFWCLFMSMGSVLSLKLIETPSISSSFSSSILTNHDKPYPPLTTHQRKNHTPPPSLASPYKTYSPDKTTTSTTQLVVLGTDVYALVELVCYIGAARTHTRLGGDVVRSQELVNGYTGRIVKVPGGYPVISQQRLRRQDECE